MHTIEAVLYPNHLTTSGPGAYLAKNTKEKTLDVEAVCAAMKVRGGYDGSYEDAVKTVRHYFKEVMYQLSDGFSINTGWFTINVSFSGVFHSVKEPFTPPKHKVTFSFHMLKAMRALAPHIEVVVNGHIEAPAFIAEFKDMEDQHMPPNMFDLGHVCEIIGQRIKIEGPPAETGLWMAPVLDPTQAVKITRIISNAPSRIEFVPVATGHADNRLEIRTRFSGAGNQLLQTRTITSNFTISRV
jgi:hypothetical protein